MTVIGRAARGRPARSLRSNKNGLKNLTELPIKIAVGCGFKEKRFYVHRNIVSAASPYFKNKLSDNSPFGAVLRIECTDADAVQVYVNWLYTGQMHVGEVDSEDLRKNQSNKPMIHESALAEWDALANCLILASTVEDKNFYNARVDCLLESVTAHNTYPASLAQKLYERLPASSPVLQLLIDYWVSCSSEKWFQTHDMELAPRSFWCAVAQAFIKNKGTPTKIPELEDGCKYHLHQEGQSTCQ